VATLSPSELSDARISWAKNGVLTTVVDDFFDVGGSEEELVNLIQLVEKYVSLFQIPFLLLLNPSSLCHFCLQYCLSIMKLMVLWELTTGGM
jgi:hypothetical protein